VSETSNHPKVFISYRWSSPEHVAWVLNFASALRASGINAILDRWHLREGQDTLSFMEAMVNDSSVQKVLMICDASYVERANSREGGVGTEAQIISAKVYESTEQEKFAAVVRELDSCHQPRLPIYMQTRLYFDMSNEQAEAENFESIVRWVFDKPFHVAPPIGPVPVFGQYSHPTGSALFKISTESRSHSRENNDSRAAGILTAIAEDAPSFRQKLIAEPDPDELVVNGIKSLKPVLDNAYLAIRQILQDGASDAADVIHRFIEDIASGWEYTPIGEPYSIYDNDVYRYFAHDLLVSFVALAMDQRRFDVAAQVLAMPIFFPRKEELTGESVTYVRLRPYLRSLDARKQRLSLNRISLHADLLMDEHDHSIVTKKMFIEADITLYARGLISPNLDWYPISALYVSRSYGSLPSYSRAQSSMFYERLSPLLLNQTADQFREILNGSYQNGRSPLSFDYSNVELKHLFNIDFLATSQ
jgi:TIR domain